MNVYLQSVDSGRYLKAESEWVIERQEARDFLSSIQALEFVQSRGLDSVQIVLSFGEMNYDLALPVRNSAGAIAG